MTARLNDAAGILLIAAALTLAGWCWLYEESPSVAASRLTGAPPPSHQPPEGDAGGDTPSTTSENLQ